MLYNDDFLRALYKERSRTVYAKITTLTFDEAPIESFEGRITGGSINIDGASAVRRTCSLTMVSQDTDYTNYNWTLNTKFKLEIGLENQVDSNYPNMIWFKQGIYLITSYNTSHSANSFSINIQGKDKMCLLNGEIGGSLRASYDFGKKEEESVSSPGVWTISSIPIYEIIREMVHREGGEPYHNIIINDLPEYGLELLEYRYGTPMYLYREANSQDTTYKNVIIEGTDKHYRQQLNNGSYDTHVISLSEIDNEHLQTLVEIDNGVDNPKKVMDTDTGIEYIFAKINYGDTAGYRQTDLVYAGDLIGNIGESVVTILDKIKNMLTEYEYYYDLDGRFVFQKKQAFISTIWSAETTGISAETEVKASHRAYSFFDGELISSFANTPNISNLKNDYAIWGERKGISSNIPVHYRYAIDTKPTAYTCIEVAEDNVELIKYNDKYDVNVEGQKSKTYSIEDYDWREIIYQMAMDYSKYNFLSDFNLRVQQANGNRLAAGRTGYEQYYVDILGFWRDIYDPEPLEEEQDNYYLTGEHRYWNKQVYEAPETINFWFDFLDTSDGLMGQYNVKNIGVRTKTENNSNVKGIYYRETPDVIFKTENEQEINGAYIYIQVPEYDTMFSVSAQGKSAKERLDELLYEYGYCIESATISTIPIYHLDANTRIYIYDKTTGLNGDYIVSKLTIPLGYNGTMSITATKAVEDIE